jgi:hypothetical protein
MRILLLIPPRPPPSGPLAAMAARWQAPLPPYDALLSARALLDAGDEVRILDAAAMRLDAAGVHRALAREAADRVIRWREGEPRPLPVPDAARALPAWELLDLRLYRTARGFGPILQARLAGLPAAVAASLVLDAARRFHAAWLQVLDADLAAEPAWLLDVCERVRGAGPGPGPGPPPFSASLDPGHCQTPVTTALFAAGCRGVTFALPAAPLPPCLASAVSAAHAAGLDVRVELPSQPPPDRATRRLLLSLSVDEVLLRPPSGPAAPPLRWLLRPRQILVQSRRLLRARRPRIY